MANNWKISAFCAGLAFCISFLFGLIGGVGFGTVILRAFLGAVIFGGLGFAADFILRRFLPELFVPAETGGNLDVTVPEINPYDRSAEAEDDFVEEAGGPDDEESSPAVGSGSENEESDDLVEEIEEVPHSEADTAASAAVQTEAAPAGSETAEAVEDLDELPDVGELDASFAVAGDDAEDGVLSKTSSGSGKAAAITDDQNPALLAKALQTVLKRDNEG
jgi:hypothetical protein